MAALYRVHLTPEERQHLSEITRHGTARARTIIRARILLLADTGKTDLAIGTTVGVHARTVQRTRQRAVLEGVDAALVERPRPGKPRALSATQEVALLTLACSDPPAGAPAWTLRVLTERLIELEIVDAISDETVRRTLKKNELKPWRVQQWCIPSANHEYVRALERVLVTYARTYDPAEPVVCLDEYPFALTSHTRDPLLPWPGLVAKQDYEYHRHGSCALFGAFQPLAGWRHCWVRQQRTAQDFAHVLRALVDEHFPTARRIHVVLDNLNTHKPSALYATFPAPEAQRLAERLVFVHTPVHGSWLNMMEIEWSVAARQALGQRLADIASVQAEVDAWAARRNAEGIGVRWHFTVAEARTVLTHLYPIPPDQQLAT